MGTLLRDDFAGSGPWSASLWPFEQHQSATVQLTRSQQGGYGVVTNRSVDYGYGRFYFGVPARADVGLRVKGRFDATGDDAVVRFFVRGVRAGRDNLDYTYPQTGYIVSLFRASRTVEVRKIVNGIVTPLRDFTIATAVGTSEWFLSVEAQGTTLRAKVWLSGQSEPDWQSSVTDDSIASGEVGFGTGYNANQVTRFDYFAADDLNRALVLTSTIGLSGSVRKRLVRTFASTMRTSGTVLRGRTVRVALASAIGLSGTVRRSFVRVFVSSMTPRGALRRGASKRFSGSMVPRAQLRFGMQKLFTRTMTMSGQVSTRFFGRIFGRAGSVRVVAVKAADAVVRIMKG